MLKKAYNLIVCTVLLSNTLVLNNLASAETSTKGNTTQEKSIVQDMVSNNDNFKEPPTSYDSSYIEQSKTIKEKKLSSKGSNTTTTTPEQEKNTSSSLEGKQNLGGDKLINRSSNEDLDAWMPDHNLGYQPEFTIFVR